MSSYRNDLKIALWHSRECGKSIRKAADALDVAIDATPFDDDELPDNPQGKRAAYLRLVRVFEPRRYR